MEKSDFLNKFSEFLQKKDILEKLLSHNNCGIIQIDTANQNISLNFFNKHYFFDSNEVNYNLNDFYEFLSLDSAIKLKEVIENLEKNRNISNNSFNLRLSNKNNSSIEFKVELVFAENAIINGVLIEKFQNNPFFAHINEYYDFVEKVLSTSKIFLWRWDTTINKQIFSKGYYEFLGYDPDQIELDYDNQRKLIHPSDLEIIDKKLNDYFGGKQDFYEIEFRMKRGDGQWQWLISKGKIVKVDENNRPLELIGVHIDINEIKRLQMENETTKMNFSNLINLVDDIICVKDGEGRWMLANEADLKLFQLENVDYVGKTDYDLSFYTSPIYKEAFKTCMVTDEIAWKKDGISRSDEIIPIDDKGNSKTYDVIKKPIFNPDGSRRALIVMGRVVTEKRKIEKIERQLANQNRIIREYSVLLLNQKTCEAVLELLTKYLSELNNNIIVVTTKLTDSYILKVASIYPFQFLRTAIKYFPEIVDRISIKLSEEYISQTIDRFRKFSVAHTSLYDASLQKIPKYLAKSIQEIFNIKYIETIGIIYENECYGYVSFFVQENDQIEDKDMIESMVHLAAQKINNLKTYQHLEDAKKTYELSNLSKDKFFSVLAHDLEQPIQNLLRFSTALHTNFSSIPVAELKKLLNELQDNVNYTNYLMENIFEWSKIEMNKIEFMPKITSIYKFYLENERLILTGSARKNLTFVNLLNQDHYVEVDNNLISMVFRNLINNSIKFTPRNGKIEIESYDIGDFIRVDIRDNGVGIDKDDLPKLFRKDIKFTTLGTEGEEGTGLGLLVAREYIQMHGGELHIDSEKNKGTIVFFTLPKHF